MAARPTWEKMKASTRLPQLMTFCRRRRRWSRRASSAAVVDAQLTAPATPRRPAYIERSNHHRTKTNVISQERLKIDVKLLLSTNRKSYVPRRLAQQRMTLSDFEWLFHASRAIFSVAELLVRKLVDSINGDTVQDDESDEPEILSVCVFLLFSQHLAPLHSRTGGISITSLPKVI